MSGVAPHKSPVGPATALATTGASVNVSNAAPPEAGQVLVASSATQGEWQTLTGQNMYTTLTANTGLGVAASREPPTAGTANLGGVAGNTSREYITLGTVGSRGNWHMVRQTGTVEQISMYFANLTNLTAVYIKVWRRNTAGTFDLVGTSNNILASLTAAQVNTVVLSSPITGAEDHDCVGYRLEWSSGAQNLYATSGGGAYGWTSNTYYVTNTTPGTSAYNWEAQTALASQAVPIELYMTPPILMSISDSMMQPNYTAANTRHDTIAGYVSDAINCTHQNLGKGGETVENLATYFATWAAAIRPRMAIMSGGTAAYSTEATWLAAYISYLDTCVANSIIPILVLAFPRSDATGTVAWHQARERVRFKITEEIKRNYSTALIVDTDLYVGVNMVGGDDGNLWGLNTSYDETASPGLHFNSIGRRYVAQAILDVIQLRG